MNYSHLYTPMIYQTPSVFNMTPPLKQQPQHHQPQPQSQSQPQPPQQQSLQQEIVVGCGELDQENPSRVKLPREVLLKFTSQEYDEYIKRLSTKRPLSEREHKVVRNQRRKIKNREYAQTSRINKKNQHTQLSNQIDHLNQQNSELIDRVNQLEAENNRLKQENRMLIDLYGSNPMLTNLDTYNPPHSPPLCQEPPLTPNSSEDSSSIDLFTEETYSDNIFSDWTSFSSKVPFTLFTVFFCLLFMYPFSHPSMGASLKTNYGTTSPIVLPPSSYSVKTDTTTTKESTSKVKEKESTVSRLNLQQRTLLSHSKENPEDLYHKNCSKSKQPLPSLILTIDDVYEDELSTESGFLLEETPVLSTTTVQRRQGSWSDKFSRKTQFF